MNAPKPIALNPITTSSNIVGIGYDAATRTLAVQFKGDRPPYHYSDVPPEVHADLLAADSIGSHHARHIKGKFSHVIADPEGGDL